LRIKAFRRGLMSILFVFALVFSLTFVATPVLAPDVISEPGGTIIEVLPGDNFTLRFRLQWDEPDAGYFAITLKWVCEDNDPAENFTIVGVSAYFDNGQPISAAVTSETESPFDNGTLYIRVIGTPAGDPNNGPFNVDITIRAGSEGFLHIPTDNHPIEIDGSILVAEALPFVDYYPPDPVITIRVTPEAPSPTAWHAALVVLIAVIILVGGYALYSIFKVGQRKQKRKRTLRV